MKADTDVRNNVSKKKWLGRDVFLNVGPKEGIVRIILGLAIGGLVFLVRDTILFVLITVVSFYLFVTGAMLFCFIKYFWRHTILGIKDPQIKDPEIPVKKL